LSPICQSVCTVTVMSDWAVCTHMYVYLCICDCDCDFCVYYQSLVVSKDFQHILRIVNTNVDGGRRVMYAMTAIKGVGRRFSSLVLKKAQIDQTRRAGELSPDEIENIVAVISNPKQYKIPDWFLNRQRDFADGKTTQVISNNVDSRLRDDIERLKRVRVHRGYRHYWGVRVRGQHTKTTGRHQVKLG